MGKIIGEKCILQYILFDSSGNHIVEGGCFVCENEKDLKETADIMVENYHNSSEMRDLGLVLINNSNGNMLYNSKEEKIVC